MAWETSPRAIRELFAYGLQRKAEIGEDKVFDYSIGNPSVPAPQKVADTIDELMKLPPVRAARVFAGRRRSPPCARPSPTASRAATASTRRPAHVYMTVGAAASIAISLGAITNPGDEVIVPTPVLPRVQGVDRNHGLLHCGSARAGSQLPA